MILWEWNGWLPAIHPQFLWYTGDIHDITLVPKSLTFYDWWRHSQADAPFPIECLGFTSQPNNHGRVSSLIYYVLQNPYIANFPQKPMIASNDHLFALYFTSLFVDVNITPKTVRKSAIPKGTWIAFQLPFWMAFLFVVQEISFKFQSVFQQLSPETISKKNNFKRRDRN